MIRSSLFSVVSILLACQLLSCNKNQPITHSIPQSALVVAEADTRKLVINAIDFNSLFSQEVFGSQEPMDDSGDQPKDAPGLTDAGLELFSKVVFFVLEGSEQGQYYNCLGVHLKDSKKFAAYIQGLGGELTDLGSYQYAQLSDQEALIGWNKNQAFLIKPGTPPEYGTISLSVLDTIFGTNQSGSIAALEEFEAFDAENAEVRLLITKEGIHKLNQVIRQYLPFHFTPGSFMVSGLNFTKGKATLSSQLFIGEEYEELAAALFNESVSPVILNNSLDDRYIGVVAAKLNPASIKQVLKTTGMDSEINQVLWLGGINLDSILHYSNGEFSFGLIKTEMEESRHYDYNLDQHVFMTDTVSYYRVGMGLEKPEYIKSRVREFYDKGLLINKNQRFSFANIIGIEQKDDQLFVFGPDKNPGDSNLFVCYTSLLPQINGTAVYCRINSKPAADYLLLKGFSTNRLETGQLSHADIQLRNVKPNAPILIDIDLYFKDKETNSLMQLLRLYGTSKVPA